MSVQNPRLAVCAFALSLGVTLALAAPTSAQGLSIGWRDCRSGNGIGGTDEDPDCTPNFNPLSLFPAIRLASRVDSVFAMELVIDVDVATDSLPPWWHVEAGGCRQNAWSANTAHPPNCPDAWAAQGVASVQGWIPGSPGGSPRHARLLVAAEALPGHMGTLAANVSYSACRVVLALTDPNGCAGCTFPSCLVFNSLLIRRQPGSSVEELLFSDPEAAGSNMVTIHGLGADCQSVPIRRRTWGALKALYH